MKKIGLTMVFALILVCGFGQRKGTTVQRIDAAVEVDGVLNEAFWQNCEVMTDFVQNAPVAGAKATAPTFVRIAYDNEAIYIGAEMLDSRDSMSLTLSQRDDFGNADWFGVVIDPYDAGTIGFGFTVTSGGVQIDELYQVNDSDKNWNAVWKSAVEVDDGKWVAEMRIPFSALRFPEKKVQLWGINFSRNIRRNREQAYWNFYDPKGINLISQLGKLDGVEGVESPLRLSFVPYVSGYVETYDGDLRKSLNGGMDLKLGLNDAFTLDMTLIPDFGQVQFDQQVLNLSPFEVQFNENRQFFTEGTELFNKQGLFYSRRVGGRPVNANAVVGNIDSNEVVVNNPSVTQLYNATKLSGRSKKGLGVGVFNAVTAPMEAEVVNVETNESRFVLSGPLSNYNVFVLDQNLKNNSSVTLTNTNVMRNGYTYDANVTAIGGDLYSKGQKYNAGATVVVSQIYQGDSVLLGNNTSAKVGKSTGNFLWKVSYNESNDRFDKNDLGFQQNNNTRSATAEFNYNIYKPFGRFYKSWNTAKFTYKRLVRPDAFSDFNIYLSANGTFKNFMTSGVWMETAPVKNLNWFEARMPGRFYEEDEFVGVGGFISSDYSKPFALDMNVFGYKYNEVDRFEFKTYVSPRFRFNDQFLMVYDYSIKYSRNDEGVALTRFYQVPMDEEDPVFSKRDRLTMINQISADYIFTNRMGVTFSLRHYWSKVEYNSFHRLDDNGRYAYTAYEGLASDGESIHNNNFNAFTIDMVYRWVFAPGSELSLVWKNSIFSSTNDVEANYFENVEDLSNLPATNSLSFKLLYYIDYGVLHNRIFKK